MMRLKVVPIVATAMATANEIRPPLPTPILWSKSLDLFHSEEAQLGDDKPMKQAMLSPDRALKFEAVLETY